MREIYKLLNGIYKMNSSDMFTVGGREGVDGHEKKLMKHATRREVHQQFFRRCVINDWIAQSMAPSLDTFRKRLKLSQK